MSFHHCFRNYSLELVHTDSKTIRLSIFLITGVCAGFPALLWAFSVLHHYGKIRGRISPFAVFLLLSDLLELILNPFILAYMVKEHSAPCTFFRLLFGVRLCGHHFLQLVMTENILIQKYPSLAVIFSGTWSIILCVVVWLGAIVCQVIPNDLIYEINICLCVLPVIVFVITYIVTFFDTNQTTKRKPDMLVISVALFFLYVSYLLTFFVDFPVILDPLASMRLISEPLLCALIFRENHMVEMAHKQSDHTQYMSRFV